MKIISNFTKITLVAFIALSSLSCSNDDEVVPQMVDNSIAGIASRTPDLSILVQALTKADLVGTLSATDASYTVFAPNNTAFNAFFTANGKTLETIDVALLKEVLLNHVIVGEKKSTDLTTGYLKTLGKGAASSTNTLSMYVNTANGVKLNGISTVTTTKDVDATNGVVHIVNAVIDLPTIVTHAKANDNFTSLVDALTSAGQPDFVSELSGTGSFTVFAPTNVAFTNLTNELTQIPLIPTTAQLTSVLQYHVVSGNVLASQLPTVVAAAGGDVPTLNMQNIKISLTGGAKITGTYTPTRQASNIVATDVQCSNGVIHVLDKVLLPVL
jgi:uncharacterized surface protein with fasciclin (FAS1) repeats